MVAPGHAYVRGPFLVRGAVGTAYLVEAVPPVEGLGAQVGLERPQRQPARAEVLRQVGILAQPFMPGSAAKLLDLLAVPLEERSFAALGADNRIKAGVTLPPPAPVFPRYVEPEAKEKS